MARFLLIALIVFGSTASVRCQALCAQPADSQAVAHARAAEAAAPGHAGCHEGGVASREPVSKGPGEPCRRACCTALTLGTADTITGPDPASAAPPMPTGVDLDVVRPGSELLLTSRPAARLGSLFQFRNPPLLL